MNNNTNVENMKIVITLFCILMIVCWGLVLVVRATEKATAWVESHNGNPVDSNPKYQFMNNKEGN